MRIAIVNVVWNTGAPTAAATLDRFPTLTGWAEAIVGADPQSTVVVYQRFTSDVEIARGGVTYRFLADVGSPKPPLWYGGRRALVSAIASFQPDVVHVNSLDYPRLVRRLRRALPHRGAIVVQDHGGFDPLTLSPIRKAWMRRGLESADALLVATPPQIEVFRASALTPPQLTVRDVMEGSTSFTAPARPVHRPLSILWVGRLNANKDPLTVVDGFARFLAHGERDAVLTFVYGSAELESSLRAAIDADQNGVGLHSRVRLVGHVPPSSLQSAYAAADLFVLGSTREGSGYAVLEAMACGVVPVLTDIPSFRGLTGGGEVGVLWRTGDPASLADALDRVTASPLEPQREACRARFDREFSWPAIGRRAIAIYREFSPT